MRPSYLFNWNSHTGMMTSLYWVRPLFIPYGLINAEKLYKVQEYISNKFSIEMIDDIIETNKAKKNLS